MKNILVAVEFDDSTDKLIQQSKQFASVFGAKLWLIHIAPEEPDFVGYHEGPKYIRDGFADELREEHRHLQAIWKSLEANGIDTEGLMVQGPTIEMLLSEADKLSVDMIITSSHKRSFLYKAFFGSVSTELFEKASIPVLAIPV